MSVALLVTVILALAFIGTSNAKDLLRANKSEPKTWSALDKLDAFMKTLDDAGFEVEQGEVGFLDWVKDCCTGVLMHTGANNPWPNAYVTLRFGGVPLMWQLGENEAIVMVGQTPPPAAYFSYNTILGTLPDNPDTEVDENLQLLGLTVGDSINIGTIKTIGPDPFNRPIVYIITGHRGTERLVRAAALKAGYPDAIINVETISPALGPLGHGAKATRWFNAQRVSVPADRNALETYLQNVGRLNKVFRVSPRDELAGQLGDDPEPVPVLRVRGTGHTELGLYPALKQLRAAILQQYGDQPFKELDTKIWELGSGQTQVGREMRVEKPYVGLQRGITVLGASRDTNYLASYPNFMLRKDVNEFVIVYGVNHQKTGKATYSSFSIYADKWRWFGLKDGTTTSPNYDDPDGDGPIVGKPGDSARRFLCPNDPNACPADVQYLYAWKVARHCNGEAYCMEAKVNDDPAKPFTDIEGNPYACTLYDWRSYPPSPLGSFDLDRAEMFFLWRAYMEPATKSAPDDNELLYDRAIYFGKYFSQP